MTNATDLFPQAAQELFYHQLELLQTRMTTHALWNEDPALVAISLLTELKDSLVQPRTFVDRAKGGRGM